MSSTEAQRAAARLKKQRQRDRQREMQRLSAIAEAAHLEALAEDMAPAVLRNPILTADGRMLCGIRVVIEAGRPVRALLGDPVADSKARCITAEHRKTARQLQQDWHDVGSGLNAGAVDYLRSGGGTGEGGHSAMLEQIATRARLDGAMAHLGAFAPAIARVVLDCVPVSVWCVEVGKAPAEAWEWIALALTRLDTFYHPARNRPQMMGILTIAPGREAYCTKILTAA